MPEPGSPGQAPDQTRESLGIVGTADPKSVPARKLDLHLALANNGLLVFVPDRIHNLDRKETGRVIDLVTCRKARTRTSPLASNAMLTMKTAFFTHG